MPNRITIPYLNPVQSVEMTPAAIPQYISKFMDDWRFEQTIHDWEQPINYRQVWLKDDAIRRQIKTNYGPVTDKLVKCDGKIINMQTWDTRQEDADNPGTFIRQVDWDLASYDPGIYYLQTEIGSGPKTLITDPFKIANEAPNTLLLEYSHPEKFGGIYFGSPFSPSLRVPGILVYNDTASRDTIYEDEPLNETILDSRPYRIFDFILGGTAKKAMDLPITAGVPPWLADKAKRIFSCQSVRIDGRYFTKQDGQKWERIAQENYPAHSWSIQLREKFNRSEQIYEDDAQVIGIAAAGLIVSTKGFGMNDDSGNDYIEITSLT